VFIPVSAWLIDLLGWRRALWPLAALHLLVCAPLHWTLLRNAPRHTTVATVDARSPAEHLRRPEFLLIGAFVVGMMAVTAALPAHLISLLREAGLSPAWVIAIPASIGAVQVLGRLLLYFFEHRFDVHLANRVIPCLIPLGLAALLVAQGSPGGALVFVVLFGMGNGMLTIVKGTAIAQYVSRSHVAALNGALGPPTALARAVAPMLLGVLWTPQAGYARGLWLLLAVSVLSVGALLLAQRRSPAAS
jgi:predicted MFS family arabinose efflux permease